MKKKVKISLFGNFGTHNLGNECTLEAMIYNIKKYNQDVSINSICSDPKDVSLKHKIDAVPMFHQTHKNYKLKTFSNKSYYFFKILRLLLFRIPNELFEWIRAIAVLRGRNFLIITGTGILSDDGTGALGFPYQILKWTFAAKICNLKVLFVSVGAESIHNSLSKLYFKASLHIADYVSYRDHHSKNYMQGLGINVPCRIYPDLAFSLPERSFPNLKKKKSPPVIIGIGLYDYCRGGYTFHRPNKKYCSYLKKVIKLIIWFVGEGYTVHILIGDIKYDEPVKQDIKTLLGEIHENYDALPIFDCPVYSVKQLLEQIEATDMIIATRFHNVVLSILLNKPVISIGYDKKNDVVMKNFGLSQYCQDIDTFKVGTTINHFEELKKHIEQSHFLYKQRNSLNRKLLAHQYRYIFSSIG